MLDIQTLLIVAVLAALILAWSMGILFRRPPWPPEAGYWSAAGLLIAAGAGLIAARNHAPDTLSIVVANLAIIGGETGFLAGVEVYCGRRPGVWLPAIVLMSTLAGLLAFTFGSFDTDARIVVVSVAQAVMCGAVAWFLIRYVVRRPGHHALDGIAALPFALHAVASVGRAIATVLYDHEVGPFLQAGPIQAAALLEAIAFLTLVTVALNFLIISRERARAEDVIWATGAGTWDWSIARDVVRVNARWAEMLGFTRAELDPVTGRQWRSRIHPADLARVERHVRDHLEGQTPIYEVEARLQHKDGHYIWVRHGGRVVEWDADGTALRMTGTHTDVTAGVARAQEIQAQRNLLAKLARQIPGVIYQVVLGPDGVLRFPYASDGLQDVFGLSPDAVEDDGAMVFDRLQREDRARVLDELRHSARTLETWRSEFRVIGPEGALSWYEGHATPESLPDGGVLWHGLITTIDARIRKRQALERYARDLEYAHQQLEDQAAALSDLAATHAATSELLSREVATKNRFFGIVAHDLRSPLTALLGLTDLLVQGAETKPAAELRAFAQHIHDSTRNLYTLLEQLLDWARLQMGSTAPRARDVPLAPLVTQALLPARAAATAKGIGLEVNVPADLAAHVDADMLHAVLRNLMSNAIKFTPTGGRIWITAGVAPDRDTIWLAVNDTGVGLDPAATPDLFNVAVKTTTPGTGGEKGTGLGLPLCAEMIRLNGGTITAEPGADGIGATVRVTLPAGQDAGQDEGVHGGATPSGDSVAASM
ncbi:PAS domain-containing protein [Roseospira marina]|uniref:histidine kinase n=1 Tax=Roseospira marina TaxID=140057 RepID=A0A5M6IDC6_9PROT|nr:PAS domain-containing protein [Roseospira marina]KAA5605735.1 PAS domain-containing protein [Roseospira marina]MBB4313536.1 PAS domain S-box-containing protein [Roseospira marina]MBB5086698.1 PAS domain S-box-containing protein [Roseospira marina]